MNALVKGISLLFFLSFCISNSYAASSNCVKALHKQAITDAINMSPIGLRNIIKPFESNMLDRIPALHAEAPNERSIKYQDYYKSLVETLRERDPKRNDYLARMLSGITVYPLSKYLPIRLYDTCDDARIIKETDIIFDGYDEKPNYSMLANSDFAELKMKYEGKTETERMKAFYNLLVNEIVDLWSNIWLQAGNNIGGLPVAGSVIREASIKKQTANRIQPLANQPEQNNSSTAVFSNDDLARYRNPSDADNSTERFSDPACNRLDQELRNARISTGRGFYGDMLSVNNAMLQFRLRCQKIVSQPTQNTGNIFSGPFGQEGNSTSSNIFPQQQKSKTVYGNDRMESGCSSDFSCGVGYKCVKAPLKLSGECMKEVDEYGLSTHRMPDTDSIGPNTNMGNCDFNTDCPIGFRCDKKYKQCVK